MFSVPFGVRILLACTLAAAAAGESCPSRLAKPKSVPLAVTARIVGGAELDKDDELVAYNALIVSTDGKCTGSVIARRWVMTAAHCGVKPGSIVHVGGAKAGGGELHRARRVFVHPEYKATTAFFLARVTNDVALVELTEPVRAARILPLNSAADAPHPATIVRASGYGLMKDGQAADALRFIDLAALGDDECKRRFERTGNAPAARGIRHAVHLCTGRDAACKDGGVCFGDSGGPLVARMPGGSLVQVGITSYGDRDCARRNGADVSVRVSMYTEWVQQVTGGAATVVEWRSVGNVATAGVYGSVGPARAAFPPWAIVAIIVAVCMTVFGAALFHLVRRKRKAPRSGRLSSVPSQGASTPPYTPPPPQLPKGVAASGQVPPPPPFAPPSPPPAFVDYSSEQMYPPSAPHPEQMYPPSAPPRH